MKVYVLIHCSEDDKQIIKMSREREVIAAHMEILAEKRRNDKDSLSCDVVWEDQETVYLQGAFRYSENGQAYDYFEEFIIEEYEVD